MTESTKTLTFLGVAVAAVAIAIVTRPSSAEFDVKSGKGKPFAEFDYEQAKRMKIVQFNEETATLREFEVAEEDGVWKIPSKGGYPADAQQQMGKAVNGVMDRDIVDVVSNNKDDHDKFGVVDPSSSKLEVGQTGVGTRVTLASSTGSDPLVDLIIGKEVKDATNNQHYVRKPTQDPVYVLEINPADFSTKFEDWIEPDLLKLNSFDVKEVALNDYTASAELVMTNQGPQLGLNEQKRAKLNLVYDEEKSQWQVKELSAFDETAKDYKPFTMTDQQELNEDTLRELKNALDDLKIVDVDRKPEGLSANLKAGGDFLKDEQAIRSLMTRGFLPVPVGPGEADVISSEGEAIVTLKDGVEYVLRFGNLKLASDDQKPDAAADATDPTKPVDPGADAEKKPEGEAGVNRYLFVMARFNENAVAKPKLEELPALPEGTTEADAAKPEAEKPEGAATETPEAADKPADATASAEGEKPAEADKPAEAKPEDAKAEDTAKQLEETIAKRKTIEQENQRKLDEYKHTLDKGRERVKELNERFGDWYYVISNDVFEKVHLGRDDVIREKKADGATDTTPAAPGSPFGAPGTAIPGLPSVPTAPAEEPAVPAEETSTQQSATESTEPLADPLAPEKSTPAAEPATDEPAPETTDP